MSPEQHPEHIPDIQDAATARELNELEAMYDATPASEVTPAQESGPAHQQDQVEQAGQTDPLAAAKEYAADAAELAAIDVTTIPVEQPANQENRKVAMFQRLGGSDVQEAYRERRSAEDKAHLDNPDAPRVFSEAPDDEQQMAHFEHNLHMLERVGGKDLDFDIEDAALLIKPAHNVPPNTDSAIPAGRTLFRDASPVYEHIKTPDQGNDMLNGILDITGAEPIRDDIQVSGQGIRLYKGMSDGKAIYIQETIEPVPAQPGLPHSAEDPDYVRSARIVSSEIAQHVMDTLSPQDEAMLAQAGISVTAGEHITRSNMSAALTLHELGKHDDELQQLDEHISTTLRAKAVQEGIARKFNAEQMANASSTAEYDNNKADNQQDITPEESMPDAGPGVALNNALSSIESSAAYYPKTGRHDIMPAADFFKPGGLLDQEHAALIAKQTSTRPENAADLTRTSIEAAHNERDSEENRSVALLAEYLKDPAEVEKFMAGSARRKDIELRRGALFASREEFRQHEAGEMAKYVLGTQIMLNDGRTGLIRGLGPNNERIVQTDVINTNRPPSDRYELEDGAIGTLRGTAPDGTRLVQVPGEAELRRIPGKPVQS